MQHQFATRKPLFLPSRGFVAQTVVCATVLEQPQVPPCRSVP